MNLRESLYLAGSAFHLRTIYLKGGKRVPVFDRTKRWKSAARCLRSRGRTDGQIARIIHRPIASIQRVLAFNFRI